MTVFSKFAYCAAKEGSSLAEGYGTYFMQLITSFWLASGSTLRVSSILATFEVKATKKLSNDSLSVVAHLYVESHSPKFVTFSLSVKQLYSELAEQVVHFVEQLSTHAESEIKFSV